MSKEEENLDMDLFANEPVIDLPESDELDYIFKNDDDAKDVIEETPDGIDNDKDDDKNNSDEEDNNSLEDVVGTNDKDDVDGDEEPGDDADNSSSNPNLFSSLTALLSEKGLISATESKIETEEDFIEHFKSEIKTSEYADLNDYQKDYLDKLREGVPAQKIEKDQYEESRLDSITEDVIKEDSDLRKRIIYQDFINKGFSDARARKNLQRSVELEADLEDSIEALESIKKYNQVRVDKENEAIIAESNKTKAAEAKRIEDIKKKIKTTDEVIKDYPISNAIKDKIENNMFNVVGKNPSTNQDENALLKYRRENPQDFDYKLYYLFTLTNGFQDFTNISKTTESRTIKDLEQAVRSTTRIKDQGSPAYLQDPDSYSIDISGHDVVVD